MRPIRRVLVAVKDPTARSLPAVAKAIQLARAFGADLEFFHALDFSPYVDMRGMAESSPLSLEDDERKQFLQRLGRIAARARLHGVHVTVAVEWDSPVSEAIVRRATRIGADLIVAERHAGRHIVAGLRGLADQGLLRLSPIPVLLVNRSRPYHRPTMLAAVDPSHAFAKPANLDQEILRVGTAMSAALRGKLHAVHADTSGRANLSVIGAAAAARNHEAETTRAGIQFDRLLRSSAIPAARRHLVRGHPSDVVRQTAGRLRCDVVVMGAISRSGLKRVFIGNTAERLLDRLVCDVLIVKPGESVNRVSRERREPRVVPVQPLRRPVPSAPSVSSNRRFHER
jgi:universal stress protein E